MTKHLVHQERERLASRLEEARARTDEIFDRVQPDALYDRPIPERHRLVFYLGHVEAFDWNLVARQAFGLEAFNEGYDRLFAFGIDPVDGGLPNEPASDWPKRDFIESYNRRVRDVVDACVAGEHPARIEDVEVVFQMAIEHRLMHAETLAYLLNQLPYSMKIAPRAPAAIDATARDSARNGRLEALVTIPEGRATLGRRRADPGFGWDNEHEEHVVNVPGFAIEKHKVTNGRFLEFLRDGGYEQRALWSDADWEWKAKEAVRHPGFWVERDGQWFYRGMFAEVPLPLEAPVYASHAEASAFARWAGGVLPTEAQFHRAAHGTPGGAERSYPWGEESPSATRGNFDFHRWDPTAVGGFPESASAFGVDELVGNGWEWTSTPFAPFAGFEAHPFYAGYSANFFDGHHYVMKGGSPRTAACMLRRSFRNWFQPHYPYVYGAFRQVPS
jgi:gamma-glutamyl hercynylcysteine S-oxide synthase